MFVVLHAIKETILGFAECEIVQPGEKSVFCVYNNADSVVHNNTAICLSLEH